MAFIYGILAPHGPDLLTLGNGIFNDAEEREKRTIDALQQARDKIRKLSPEVIVSSSPHWAPSEFAIDSSLNPQCLHDYYGFPSEFYSFSYTARNDLSLATKILHECKKLGVKAKLSERGLDHGHWIPLRYLSTGGSIPVVPVSISLDGPEEHIKFGKAIANAVGDRKAVFIAGAAILHRLDTLGTGENVPEGESYLIEAIKRLEDGKADKIFDIEGYYDAAPEGNLGTLMELIGAMKNPKGRLLGNEIIGGIANTVMEFL